MAQTGLIRRAGAMAGGIAGAMVRALDRMSSGVGLTGGPATVAKDTLSQYAQRWMAGMGTSIAGSLNEPLSPYQQSLWVYRCVREIQTSARGVPVRLSGAGPGGKVTKSGRIRPVTGRKAVCTGKAAEGDLIESGEAVELLNRPNAYQTWPQLVEALVGYLLLRGKVGVILDEMTGRRPGSMHVIDGREIKPVWGRDGRGLPVLEGYLYSPANTGRQVPLAVDEVKYFTLWDDGRDPLGGMSPLTPGRLAVASDYNASLFNASMFANGCDPSMIVEYPGTVTEPQLEQFRQMLRERHQGPGKAKGPLVLGGGGAVKSFQTAMNDMQFDQGKRTTRLEICCLFGVPPVVAGWVDAAGDSSAYTSNALQQFWQQTMFPMLDGLTPAFQEIVGRFDSSAVLWFDVEDQPVVQQMRLSRMTAAKQLFDMGYPPNEISDLLDLGMPKTAWGDVGMLPAGLMPAALVATGEILPPVAEGPSGEGNDSLDQPTEQSTNYTNDANGQKAGGPQPSNLKAQGPDPAFKALADHVWRQWERSWAPLAVRLKGLLRTRYIAQERAVIAALKKRLDPATGSARFILSQARQPATKDDAVVARVLLDAFGAQDAKTFAKRMRAFVTDANELGITQALVEAGFEGDRLTDAAARLTSNPAILAAIRSEAVVVSTRVDAATRTILRNQLARGMEAGEDIRALADRVQNVMANRRGAAMTVARNAVGQTLSRSRMAGQLAAGMTHKYWIHSRATGERRPAHVEAESRYREMIPINEPFVINGVSLMYPRDASANAPAETVNCQCLHLTRRRAAPSTGSGQARSISDELTERLVKGFVGWEEVTLRRAQGGPDEALQQAQDRDREHDDE